MRDRELIETQIRVYLTGKSSSFYTPDAKTGAFVGHFVKAGAFTCVAKGLFRGLRSLRQRHRRRIVSKPGQWRDPKSAGRSFRSQLLTGFEPLSPGTEDGDIQDVIVEVVQGASVANADYRRPPGRGAQQAKEMRLGPLIQRRGRFV